MRAASATAAAWSNLLPANDDQIEAGSEQEKRVAGVPGERTQKPNAPVIAADDHGGVHALGAFEGAHEEHADLRAAGPPAPAERSEAGIAGSPRLSEMHRLVDEQEQVAIEKAQLHDEQARDAHLLEGLEQLGETGGAGQR